MIVLTGFYRDPDKRRQAEFLECVRRNVANPCIDEVHVFVEDSVDGRLLAARHPELAAAKVRLVQQGRRLRYRDLFDHANRSLAGRCVAIANSDIYFDHTLARLNGYDLCGKLLCLSRWDVQPDGSARLFEHPLSQDAWIFRAPLPPFPCDFQLGVPGCDNHLAWQAERAGLELANPSRSIRCHHLHASGVRRYTERQRLTGPTRPVPAGPLGTPWLWFVVACKDRLEDLRATIDTLVAQRRSSYVMVDYSCDQQSGAWVRRHHPSAIVEHVPHRDRFDAAEARNAGASVAEEDGILCFLDADVAATASFSDEILGRFECETFLVSNRERDGLRRTLICSKAAFDRVGGYDEALLGSAEEVLELTERLRRAGLSQRTFPAELLHHCRPARGAVAANGRAAAGVGVATAHAAYRSVKAALLQEFPGASLSIATRRAIFAALARPGQEAPSPNGDGPVAAVAFRENMGYTIARLSEGVSSHNNDPRPISAVPQTLAGRPFTQVVSCSVSPVEVEFLESGKLYVLVGTDWEGYRTATTWLRTAGQPEPVPMLQTECGRAFEVWSLVRSVGARIVLPTQVMLVAQRLVQR